MAARRLVMILPQELGAVRQSSRRLLRFFPLMLPLRELVLRLAVLHVAATRRRMVLRGLPHRLGRVGKAGAQEVLRLCCRAMGTEALRRCGCWAARWRWASSPPLWGCPLVRPMRRICLASREGLGQGLSWPSIR